MSTMDYSNDEYSVYTEGATTTTRGHQLTKGDINVYKDDKDTPETMHPFATIEDAIAFADQKKVELEQRRAEAAAAKAKAEEEAKALAARGPLATERQVSYIMALLAQTDGGQGAWFSGPTTLEGVRALSRRDASAYISALRGE